MENNVIDYRNAAIKLFSKVFPKKKDNIKSVKQIHEGYTNVSFLITLNDETKYQVRIPGPGGAHTDRRAEKKILDLVQPNLYVYFDVKTGKAIKKWIEGVCPSKTICKNNDFLDKLFTKIKKIHSIKVKPSYHIAPLNQQSYNSNLSKLKFDYQRKYLCLMDRRREEPLVINHSDINPLNIIYNKTNFTLIDFEWVCLASDYWDYANWIRESDININKIQNLDWSKYIKNFDLEKLYDYIFMSSVFAYLWTYIMPQTRAMIKYRKTTYKQIKKSYAYVIRHEKICYK